MDGSLCFRNRYMGLRGRGEGEAWGRKGRWERGSYYTAKKKTTIYSVLVVNYYLEISKSNVYSENRKFKDSNQASIPRIYVFN